MNQETLPELMSVQAQAIVGRAKALGLTWTLRPGTVETGASNPPLVTLDSDSEQINVFSLIGTVLPSERVMVIQVPPAGNFIIGRVESTVVVPLSMSSFRGKVVSLADVTLTTASQAVSPLTSITVASAAEYQITAWFHLDQTVAAGANFTAGAMQVDGVGLPEQAFFGTSIVSQATVGQSWNGSLTAGTHTFQLISAKSLNIGTFICRALNTGFSYQIWQ